jgi:hypothetical protein
VRQTDPGPSRTAGASRTNVATPTDGDPRIGIRLRDVLEALNALGEAAGRNNADIDPRGCLDGGPATGTPNYWPSVGGRATGADVCLTGPRTGTGATVTPPGFGPGMDRGHLIARALGGSGGNPDNIVPLYKRANILMRDFAERQVARRVAAGERILYVVVPQYTGNNPVPDAVLIYAEGNRGFFSVLRVANRP